MIKKLVLIFIILFFASEVIALPILPNHPWSSNFGIDGYFGSGRSEEPWATTIYKVTNLDNTGTGSFREAVTASGPRTVIFEVSGNIDLTSAITISHPYLTIAGQTAPNPGITICGGEIKINTHDILIQHIRIRLGWNAAGEGEGHAIQLNASTSQEVYNIVFDHCSFSWGEDETVGMWQRTISPEGHVYDVTIWKCIISEGLNEDNHGFGLMLNQGNTELAAVRNLLAHNYGRCPYNNRAQTVIVNNIFYNYGYRATDLAAGAASSITKASIEGNDYIPGNDTTATQPINIRSEIHNDSEIYLDNNMEDDSIPEDPWDVSMVNNDKGEGIVAESRPLWPTGLTVATPSSATRQIILNEVGARPIDRDDVDDRIIEDVGDGSGNIIDTESDVGGFPSLEENTRSLTTPANPNDDSGNGYTNLEVWLQGYATQVEGSPTTAALTGTLADGATEAQIVAGGETLIITLSNDTWVATVGDDNAITDALIAGLDSGGAEAHGWDVEVKGNMVFGDVTRTNDTVVTITLGAEASYAITQNETITATIPASALTESDSQVVATPTFEITATPTPSAALTGTLADNATEAQIVAGGETLIITLTNDTWVAAGETFDAIRQDIIDGMDSAQSEATGWNAEVRDKEVVTAVVRTNNTVVTITLTASASYDISANESITMTVPASAVVTSEDPVVATPTFAIIFFDTSTEEVVGMTLQ